MVVQNQVSIRRNKSLNYYPLVGGLLVNKSLSGDGAGIKSGFDSEPLLFDIDLPTNKFSNKN